ncbi:hypothetical protein PALB_14340 [Pseudoalteromonas luteoviolacea B = ATCC 29581]|nr:hypothetical protein PALB_14340 [Pseudoalteromonas luteoviolacea B = ATCC 29581]
MLSSDQDFTKCPILAALERDVRSFFYQLETQNELVLAENEAQSTLFFEFYTTHVDNLVFC